MTAVTLSRPPTAAAPWPFPLRTAAALGFAIAAFPFGPDVLFAAIAAGILTLFARTRSELAGALVLPALARLALAGGLFHFNPPSQIVDLVTRGVDPMALLLQNDIWWPRYLLTYPAVIAMDVWGLRFGQSFALYTAAVLSVEVAVLYRIVESARLPDRQPMSMRLRALILVMLVVLCFGLASRMNGRLLVAYVGLAIILAAQSEAAGRGRFTPASWAMIAVGLVMGQMSTGVGAVAAAQAVIGSLVAGWRSPEERRAVGLAVLLLVAVSGPFLYRSELKNVLFFGGGATAIIGLLEHGAGGYVLDRPPLLVAIALVAIVLGVAAITAVTRGWPSRIPLGLRPVGVALPIALAGGLFGFSTLTMVIPPVFALAAFGVAAAAELTVGGRRLPTSVA
jgi:hypothetical protein